LQFSGRLTGCSRKWSSLTTGTGDRRQTGKSSRYIASHSHQLSLAIPAWVSAVNTSKS